MSKVREYKESLFVAEYLRNNMNGKQAAIYAGYSAKTADQAASRMLKSVKVAQKIKELQAKALDVSVITVGDLLKEILPILKSPKSKDADRIRAAEFLARLGGLITEKRELTGKNGVPLVPPGPIAAPIDLSKVDDKVLLALIEAKGTVPSPDAPAQV